MRQIKINDRLFIHEQPVTVAQERPEGPVHHIWLFDRSGSMYPVVGQLVEDMVARLDLVKPGDLVTVGWFSGPGQYGFIVKGFAVQDGSKERFADILRKYASTVGTTCFSEILGETSAAINDLWELNDTVALIFFTDGYPVVSNYAEELVLIDSALAKLRLTLASALLVGYGHDYNRELMADISGKLGGELVHATEMEEYRNFANSFIEESRVTDKVAVTPEAVSNCYFSVQGNSVNTYIPTGNRVSFTYRKKSRNSLFSVIDEPEPGVPVVEFDPEDRGHSRIAYGAAIALSQRTKTDLALDVLAKTGDVAMMKALFNAFTNDEYGKAASALRKAIASPKFRLTEGRNHSYLPNPSAFCVVDLSNILMNGTSKFAPNHPEFQYQRIGVKVVEDEAGPKFVRQEGAVTDFANLAWNDAFLNLSFLTQIPGHVQLGPEAAALGLASPYPTYIWRTFSIVKDGNINIRKLPVVFDETGREDFNKLKAEGVIDGDAQFSPGEPVVLHVDRIPVMNRSIAAGKTSATELVKLSIQELELEARIKALNFLKKSLEEKGAVDLSHRQVLTDAQVDYLAKYGVGNRGFSAPGKVDDTAPVDVYYATEFTVKIKSFSSLPKVVDVINKADVLEEDAKAGKKVRPLRPAEALVLKKYDEAMEKMPQQSTPSQKLTWVVSEMAITRQSLLSVRREVQKTKFAVILAKKWFDEFSSWDKADIQVDDYQASLNLRRVEKQYTA